MHHYCQGLTYLLRLKFHVYPLREKQASWRQANKEFDYVLRNAQPDFVLRPEILTRKGEVLVNLERRPEATQAFQEAIERKANYWPAYVGLAKIYQASGDTEKAKEVIETGLTQAPEAKPLRELLVELGASRTGTKDAPATGKTD
jgi:tetratricopeptide (TPR) repeat protein